MTMSERRKRYEKMRQELTFLNEEEEPADEEVGVDAFLGKANEALEIINETIKDMYGEGED